MGWMLQSSHGMSGWNHSSDLQNTILLLITPKPERLGASEKWPDEIYHICTSQYAFHSSSRIFPLGKKGEFPHVPWPQIC